MTPDTVTLITGCQDSTIRLWSTTGVAAPPG